MKTFLKWVLYLIFLILPLMLLRFVGFLGNQMRWEIGSPTIPGANYIRWSHAYLILGSICCFILYIPTVIAILKRKLKPLLVTTGLIVLLIIGSIALTIIGKNIYGDQQIKNAKIAIERSPNDYAALQGLAIAYAEKGEYSKAIDFFTKALSITNNPGEVIHNRGLAYANSGQYELAIADFTKAIDLNDKNKDFFAQCYNDRGYAYFKSEQYRESSNDVIKALGMGYKVDPDFIAALEEKGFKVSR